MTDQPRILACSRVADQEPRDLLPGSVIATCGSCVSPVFVSLSGQAERRRNPSIAVMCLRCVVVLVEERERRGKDPIESVPVEGGAEEVVLHLAAQAAAGDRRPS